MEKHVLVGVIFLVISILCVCGIIPYIINVLNNINEKIFLKFKWEIKRCDNKMTIFFEKICKTYKNSSQTN